MAYLRVRFILEYIVEYCFLRSGDEIVNLKVVFRRRIGWIKEKERREGRKEGNV